MSYPAPIRPRAYRERRDPDLIPFFLSVSGEYDQHLETSDWSAFTFSVEELVGEKLVLLEHGRPQEYKLFVVTRSDGLKVPAWGRGGAYVVCQSSEHKAGR